MMKIRNYAGLVALLLLLAGPAWAQLIEVPLQVHTPRPYSPMAEVGQTIGLTRMLVRYSRPRVMDERFGNRLDRSGRIWGGVVPYSTPEEPQVWRAGANENTTLSLSDEVQVEGQSLPKGVYGLHMLVYADGKVTVIFSKNATSWGSFSYNEAEDVLRVDVAMQDAPHAESLTYEFEEVTPNSATLYLRWERKRIPLRLKVDVDSVVLENYRRELRSSAGFEWRGWYGAARYCYQNAIHTEEALEWAQQSVNMERRFENLQLLGQIQEALGLAEEAQTTISDALSIASAIDLYSYATDLERQGQLSRADSIHLENYRLHPHHWVGQLSMAQAEERQQRLPEAIALLKQALAKAPSFNKPDLQAHIERLEKHEAEKKKKKK